MFELSSEPSIFFQHNLKYIGAGVRHTASHICFTNATFNLLSILPLLM